MEQWEVELSTFAHQHGIMPRPIQIWNVALYSQKWLTALHSFDGFVGWMYFHHHGPDQATELVLQVLSNQRGKGLELVLKPIKNQGREMLLIKSRLFGRKQFSTIGGKCEDWKYDLRSGSVSLSEKGLLERLNSLLFSHLN